MDFVSIWFVSNVCLLNTRSVITVKSNRMAIALKMNG